MKVAVSSTGEDLDAQIDPRFGRCQYFIIVDLESMKYEAVLNESAMASGGAGIGSSARYGGARCASLAHRPERCVEIPPGVSPGCVARPRGSYGH